MTAIPLSYQQQTYWEAEQRGTVGYRLLDGGQHVANAFAGVRIQGALNLAALRRALDEVLRRHAALRIRFETIGDRLMQCITDTDEAPFELVDVSGVADADRDEAVASAAAEAALGRFSHTAGVLLRACAIRVSSRETILVFSMPHLVSDAASMQVLISDALTLYAHFLHGRPSPLPDPAVHYGDYVRWQRDWVRGEIDKDTHAYVADRFTGARPLRLPLGDRAGDDPADVAVAEEAFVLDAGGLAGVRAIATRQRVTPFVVMLSAFTVLLSRWSGQTDILLLTPFAARPDATMQKVIGLFSNLCPLRLDLASHASFTDVVEQTQEAILRAMHFRCVPHAVLADRLGGRGDISCNGVGVNAVPDGGSVMPRGCRNLFGTDTTVSPYVVDVRRHAVRQTRGHLSFWVGFRADGGISGRLMYRRASFDAGVMPRIARAFLDSIAALTAHPGRRLSEQQV